jgi:AraC-like DNA-binding protein
MKTNFNMDISESSRAQHNTPGTFARQLPFYVNSFGHYFAGPKYFTDRVGQDNYLLIYTLSGEGHILYRKRDVTVSPGQAFFISCIEHQFYETGLQNPWEFKWIHCAGTACQNFFQLINENSFNPVSLSDSASWIEQLDSLEKAFTMTGIQKDLRTSTVLHAIFSEMLMYKAGYKDETTHLKYNSSIDTVVDFIHQNYREKLKIEDLSKQVHWSEYHFLRVFKKSTGLSPYDYIINYRINKSKSLLKETPLTVEGIAYEVGFGNVNNFIRDFKKLTGTTPLRFRNYWIT